MSTTPRGVTKCNGCGRHKGARARGWSKHGDTHWCPSTECRRQWLLLREATRKPRRRRAPAALGTILGAMFHSEGGEGCG